MSQRSSILTRAGCILALGVSLVFSGQTLAFSQNADAVWEKFSAYDADSTVRVDHEPLTEFLNQVVLNVGRSKARLGRTKPKTYRESHITYGNTSPSRFEGNRVMFHAFADEHREFILAYIAGLERLSQRRSLATMNRDQQLAYWLNLHNLMVLNLLSYEYPVKNLKALRMGSSRQQSQWDAKVVTVEDVPLSIRDIELIVMKNWDSPLVIYGLYQGSIGGPSLPNYAFEGDDVWETLNTYAREFVNSNRGVRPKGSKADVSVFYEWNMTAFDGSEDSLMRHIQDYSDEAFLGDISGLQRLKPDYYDWVIADLLGGVLHGGRPNQMGGILSGNLGSESAKTLSMLRNFFPVAGAESYPPQALELITEVLINNDVPRRTPVVTVLECGPNECLVTSEEENDQ